MFISYKAFTPKCWWSRKLSQATPPGGYLKAQIACSFHTGLLLQNVGDQEDFPKLHLQVDTWRHRKHVHFIQGFYYKMLVLKKTFPSYTSRWIPEGTDSMFISYKAFTLYFKMLVIKKTFPSYTSSRMPEGTDNMFILLFTCLIHVYMRLFCYKMLVLRKTFPSYTSSRMPEGTTMFTIIILDNSYKTAVWNSYNWIIVGRVFHTFGP